MLLKLWNFIASLCKKYSAHPCTGVLYISVLKPLGETIVPLYENQSIDLLANQLTGVYMMQTLSYNGAIVLSKHYSTWLFHGVIPLTSRVEPMKIKIKGGSWTAFLLLKLSLFIMFELFCLTSKKKKKKLLRQNTRQFPKLCDWNIPGWEFFKNLWGLWRSLNYDL